MQQLFVRPQTRNLDRAAFADADLGRFGQTYPDSALDFSHNLAGHPLLSIDSIIELARRLPENLLEYNRADIDINQPDETKVPRNSLTFEETLKQIETCQSWACLHNIQIDPTYAHLMYDCLAEVEPMVNKATGRMWKPEGYLFVSSPNAITPFHIDPEYNILMQLQGVKYMSVISPHDETFASAEIHERFHAYGRGNFPFDEEAAAQVATTYTMNPGDAVYIPLKAPHWVTVGPEISVSFSITWRSDDSDRQRHVYLINHQLRKFGLKPGHYTRSSMTDRIKSVSHRIASRLRPSAPGKGTVVR